MRNHLLPGLFYALVERYQDKAANREKLASRMHDPSRRILFFNGVLKIYRLLFRFFSNQRVYSVLQTSDFVFRILNLPFQTLDVFFQICNLLALDE